MRELLNKLLNKLILNTNWSHKMHISSFSLSIIFGVFLLSACGGSSTPTQNVIPPSVEPSINQMGGSIQTPLNTLSNEVTTVAGVFPGFTDGTGMAARFTYPRGLVSDGAYIFIADSGNNVIRKIVKATGAVSTLAGTAGIAGSADGIGTVARFNNPTGIATDGSNLYIADTYNNTIRKIVIATGAVTTLVGTAAHFFAPVGITTDGINLYVTDSGNCTVRKIDIASGVVTTLAGVEGRAGSTDGTGSGALFSGLNGIATDGTNLYIADNTTIRKLVLASGAVTTLAGTADVYSSNDGLGAAASFSGPIGLTLNGNSLYVTDTNGYSLVRKIDIATGAVTTLAGFTSGSADGNGRNAQFYIPWGITTDGNNLFVADTYNHTIRKVIIATNDVTTLAGYSPAGSNDGSNMVARFNYPAGLTTDGNNLYISDAFNNTIRKIEIASGVVTTLAGTAGTLGSADGIGAAAKFNYPAGITTDGINLYVSDYRNNAIRKIVIGTAAVTTMAGGSFGSADGVGISAQFNSPYGITTDGINVYVADSRNHTIRKINISTGVVTTLAGTAGTPGSVDGTGTAALLNDPVGVTTDGSSVYVAERGNNTIRKIALSSGVVTTLAGTAGTAGSTDGTGPEARFVWPWGLATDGTNLFVTDRGNNIIRKIVIATGTVTTLAGTTAVGGYTDGVGSEALFQGPAGMTTDGISLYITDTSNNTIRKIH